MNDDLMAEEDLRGGNPGTGHSGPVMAAIFPPLIDICLIYCPDTGPRRGECQVSSAQIVLFWFHIHNVFHGFMFSIAIFALIWCL